LGVCTDYERIVEHFKNMKSPKVFLQGPQIIVRNYYGAGSLNSILYYITSIYIKKLVLQLYIVYLYTIRVYIALNVKENVRYSQPDTTVE